MNDRCFILFYFILFFVYVFFSFSVCSSVDSNKSRWVYDKVSNTDVFGHRDPNMIAHLDEMYKKSL